MIRDGKKVNIEKRHIYEIYVVPTCIAGTEGLTEEQKTRLQLEFQAVKLALFSGATSLQDKVIDTVLGDLVAGAYQDKLVAYTKSLVGGSR